MLKGQVAIITGASRGIGKAIAHKLAEKGAKLALVGSSEEIHKTGEELKKQGFVDVETFQVDVANEEQMNRMVSETIQKFGRIDLLVNNAGIGFFKPVEETTIDEWKRVFEVNVQGVFIGTKAVLPHMKKQKSGTIITISSDVGRYTIPNGAAYTATKYAVQGFSGSLAQEVREYGIRVGTINPGMVDTYFANSVQGAPEKQDWLKAEDIADAVVYMASAPKHMLIDEIVLHPLIQKYPIA
ncbi:NADP-dependent 3-hydroxy acid dehydrogenase YdfG [Thermolongibacillus altinsuensis]|uniref:NADP-dependent 3-hydroxy acid dehydrogenase YdfG n=1 Tax=Thermolongibacillus altinsuensis TaxID=575256 RepID=A0A4V2QAF2_9BACL|nr:SDR family oxidoreductase [Thermolongibacillus altinsuensis]TCL51167.1 NADP-dependent 3-hydroxy acid dehydrogenase YdfG [Thermolongibacillus altinsuensis]GMB08765.1 clavaldehyde dehydrogenase [Thermolongibacillus altinsuensis]